MAKSKGKGSSWKMNGIVAGVLTAAVAVVAYWNGFLGKFPVLDRILKKDKDEVPAITFEKDYKATPDAPEEVALTEAQEGLIRKLFNTLETIESKMARFRKIAGDGLYDDIHSKLRQHLQDVPDVADYATTDDIPYSTKLDLASQSIGLAVDLALKSKEYRIVDLLVTLNEAPLNNGYFVGVNLPSESISATKNNRDAVARDADFANWEDMEHYANIDVSTMAKAIFFDQVKEIRDATALFDFFGNSGGYYLNKTGGTLAENVVGNDLEVDMRKSVQTIDQNPDNYFRPTFVKAIISAWEKELGIDRGKYTYENPRHSWGR